MTTDAKSAFPVDRVDWVDSAKGICIIMVVMMHSVLGVEAAAGDDGWMHPLVAFAKPFRMPDFFLISGLFLARVIDRDWRTYLDRKVVHFAYFYLLWTAIQFAVRAPVFVTEMGWEQTGYLLLESLVEPFGTLWFIYLLPIFFVVTKATKTISPAIIWTIGALLEMSQVATGWTVVDEFAARFVYFYSGYLFAAQVFATADAVKARPQSTMITLMAWAVINAVLVRAGFAGAPVISLMLGFAGAIAIVAMAVLLTRVPTLGVLRWLDLLRWLGEHSIVIYLAFFLPMATTRVLLLKAGIVPDIGSMSLIVTIAGVAGSVLIWRAARAAHANFLFERPDVFRLTPKPVQSQVQAAE